MIAEEMNVKEVLFIDRVDDIASVGYDPNFNEIRALCPDKLPAVIKAVKTGAFAVRQAEGVEIVSAGPNRKNDVGARLIFNRETAN